MTPERVKEEVKSILRRLKSNELRNKKISTVDTRFTIENSFTTDVYLVDTTSGDVLIVLPNAESCEGREWTFKKLVAANDVHLQPVESQLVDGQLTYTFSNQYESVTIISSGDSFYITAQVT